MSDSAAKLCGNCRTELKFLKRENIQLGKHSFLLGDWSHLLAGAQDLEFWVCPNCRKLELFVPEESDELTEETDVIPQITYTDEMDAIAQVTCPVCGTEHDLDDPKCPRCGAKNTALY